MTGPKREVAGFCKGETIESLQVSCSLQYPQGFLLDVNFTAPSGITALFGASGCGKTTTLELIAGLRNPAEGEIRYGDAPLFDYRRGVNLPPERRGVGYISQDDLLFPHLSVRKNLEFGMRRAKPPQLPVDDVASALQITELLERGPATLSGGQRQRVALGRAILSGPRILLMDEPVSAIDERMKRSLLRTLSKMVSQLEILAIFVSHDQVDVRQFADWVILMDNGRVVASGSTPETLDDAFQRGASVATPTNVISIGEIRQGDGVLHGTIGKNSAVLPEDVRALDFRHACGVAFRACDVLIARQGVEGLSVRNSWGGIVLQIVAAAHGVFVQVDVGEKIWAEITSDALRALGLRIGEQVVCLVKTSAIQIVS